MAFDPVEERLLAALLPEDWAWLRKHGWRPPARTVATPTREQNANLRAWGLENRRRAGWDQPAVPYWEPPSASM